MVGNLGSPLWATGRREGVWKGWIRLPQSSFGGSVESRSEASQEEKGQPDRRRLQGKERKAKSAQSGGRFERENQQGLGSC